MFLKINPTKTERDKSCSVESNLFFMDSNTHRDISSYRKTLLNYKAAIKCRHCLTTFVSRGWGPQTSDVRSEIDSKKSRYL